MKVPTFRSVSGSMLILCSVPMFFVGGIWTLGGSRPHLSVSVSLLGIVVLLLALTFTAIGLCLLLSQPTSKGESCEE